MNGKIPVFERKNIMEDKYINVLIEKDKLIEGEDGEFYFPLSEEYRLIIRNGIIEGDYDPNLEKII